ncbi:hypothetical protein BT93_H3716 [Corymbia citriodora subsp. variegata]|nr:hypothetical protein BT93_H3716 [Corymbia citriodora subsp. variegata]
MVIYKLLLKAAVLGALLGLYHKHLAQADDSITKPGCQSSCGNLSIPYPFGLSDSDPHCRSHINPSSFRVDCDNSTKPPVAYFWNKSSTIKILNISVEDHELRINTLIVRDCYNSSGYDASSSKEPSQWLADFPFSSTKNKFIAIGCDTAATFLEIYGNFSFGCMSSCSRVSDVSNGSCTGIGCCETSIPKNTFNYRISIKSFSNHSNVLGFNPCSYAFVAEIGSYNFSVGDLKQLNFNPVPRVLDWAIGNQPCEEAKKNSTSYMCTKNTICTDAENGHGYKCTCSEGYRGNPYLENGCHDIDECANSKNNPCEKICHNVIGSYTCSCPNGYHGDGKKGGGIGQGCTPSKLMVILVGVAAGIGAIVLLLLCWWLHKYTKRSREARLKQKFFQRNGGIVLQQRLFSIENNHMEKGKLFSLIELDTATDHFNENRILGQGGQGTVYKGMLLDGTIIAVKKSKVIDIGQVEQFVNEIVILSKINHRNVVKLLGFCFESEVPLLIYEFVPNGTLYQYLHDPDKEFPVSWAMRLRIASEIAGALSYLHSATAIPVYHRDIKSSNILLDERYRAKVSDFGVSRSITIDQTHLTTMVRGTFGYLDPEYYQTSQFTDKSDVYSFGVVLVELLTREKPISQLRAEEDRNLASYFIISMEENRLFDVLDKEVLDHGKNEEIIVVSNLAKRCLGLHGRYRPTMKEVAMELERLQSLQNPTVIRQNEEEIDCIRTESICVSSTIPMLMQLEAGIELTSMEEDQSLLSRR